MAQSAIPCAFAQGNYRFRSRTFSHKSGFAADGFTVVFRSAVNSRDNNLKVSALPPCATRPEKLRFSL